MITSPANAKLKRLTLLMKKGIQRRAEGVFVIEGFKMFMEVLNQFPDNIEEVFLTEVARNQLDYELGPIMNSVKYELVEDKLFENNFFDIFPKTIQIEIFSF